MKNIIIKVLLAAIIVFIGYLVVMSIKKPVDFETEKTKRELAVIERLKQLRDAQLIYKSMNGSYAPNFDSLITFMEVGEIPIFTMERDPEDTTFTKYIYDTIGYVKVKDSIFGRIANFNVDDAKLIPFSKGSEFTIAADTILKGQVKVYVFEIAADYREILKGMDEQLILNLIKKMEEYNKFTGLKVGSLTEPSTDGNWEY